MTSSLHSFWKALCTLSLLSLVHCAYSAAQHRSYLRLTRLEFTYLPSDIVVQTIISLVLTIFSASFVAGDFQQIRADMQVNKKSWDIAGNCPSFYVFDHRAKCLLPSILECSIIAVFDLYFRAFLNATVIFCSCFLVVIVLLVYGFGCVF